MMILHFGGDYHNDSIKSSPLLTIDRPINSHTIVRSTQKLLELFQLAVFTAFLYSQCSINSADLIL